MRTTLNEDDAASLPEFRKGEWLGDLRVNCRGSGEASRQPMRTRSTSVRSFLDVNVADSSWWRGILIGGDPTRERTLSPDNI
jgi:hypothetical protein